VLCVVCCVLDAGYYTLGVGCWVLGLGSVVWGVVCVWCVLCC